MNNHFSCHGFEVGKAFPTRSHALALLALTLLLSCTALLAAPPKAAAPPPAGQRFLFVVETSSAMLPFDHAGRQAVFDLLFSGIDGQTQPGDTIGLWTFGREVHGGVFPMQVWQPEQKLPLASRASLFLKGERYETQARLDGVLPKLLSLIKAVQDVNVIVVSGPGHTWKGTVFDAEINQATLKLASDSLISKRPLITTLVAQKGALASWSVTLAGEPIVLPKVNVAEAVPTAQPVPTLNITSQGTNLNNGGIEAGRLISMSALPDSALTTSPTTGQKESPKATAAPIKRIVITSKQASANVEPEPGDVRITVRDRPPAATAETPPAVNSNAENTTPKEDGSVARAGTPASPAPASAREKTAPVVQAPPLSGFAPAPLPIAARETPVLTNELPLSRAALPLAAAIPPQPFLSSRSFFLIGGAFTLASVGLFLLAWRSFRAVPRPSYITRSFERKL